VNVVSPAGYLKPLYIWENALVKTCSHIKILGIVTVAWAIFWLIGWPEYYRQYSLRFMLMFDAAVLVPLWFVVCRVLRATPQRQKSSRSLWLAFYITGPLSLYDSLYCGVYLKYGWSFILEFWYLSIYYVIPWILCPVMGIWLSRRAEQTALGATDINQRIIKQ